MPAPSRYPPAPRRACTAGTELNGVSSECGLALGELIQDEEEKRLLIIVPAANPAPAAAPASTNGRGKNHLKLVVIDAVEFARGLMPKRTDISSILIIGAGPIVIGQAAEFDYSG